VKLRQLHADATERLRQSLQKARDEDMDRDELLEQIATLATSGTPVGYDLPDARPEVTSRLQLGEHLVAAMRDAPPEAIGNPAAWTWLTLAYFDLVFPADSAGPGEDARYILSEEPQRYYRHLLYGPYLVVAAHRKEAKGLGVLLGNAPDKPGDVWEQIASRQDLIASPKIVEAIGRLYYDRARNAAKPGAAAKGPGSIRRFVNVVSQLDCTWDLWEVPVEELIEMLPEEFDRFLSVP